MPAFLAQPDTQVVQYWNSQLADYARDDNAADSIRFDAARRASKEARLAIGRIWFSVYWRELWASATSPRYLDPIADAGAVRAFFQAKSIDFDGLLDAASLHFGEPQIHRRTEPLTPEELEKLVEDDERSITG